MNKLTVLKRLLLIAVVLASGVDAFATHFATAELTYEFRTKLPNGKLRYDLYLKVVRDQTSGLELDDRVTVGVYFRHNNQRADTVSMNLLTPLNRTFSFDCIGPTSDNRKLEIGLYRGMVDLSEHPGGYMFNWDQCCRVLESNLTTNSQGVPDQPTYALAEITSLDTNSSCRTSLKVLGQCVREKREFALSVHDPDGDSIVVNVVPPLQGSAAIGSSNIRPTPALTIVQPKPLDFRKDYSSIQPFGAQGIIEQKENYTFEIMVPQIGAFVTALEIKEFRNGQLVGSRIDDLIVYTFNCLPNWSGSPHNLTARKLEDGNAALDWEGCDATTDYYYIYKRINNNVRFQLIDSTPGWKTDYIDSTTLLGDTYRYYIEAHSLDHRDSGRSNEVTLRFFKLGETTFSVDKPVQVYPNPAKDILTVVSDNDISHVEVIDLNGRLMIFKPETKDTESVIQIDGLERGVYLCRVTGNQRVSVVRFMKE